MGKTNKDQIIKAIKRSLSWLQNRKLRGGKQDRSVEDFIQRESANSQIPRGQVDTQQPAGFLPPLPPAPNPVAARAAQQARLDALIHSIVNERWLPSRPAPRPASRSAPRARSPPNTSTDSDSDSSPPPRRRRRLSPEERAEIDRIIEELY